MHGLAFEAEIRLLAIGGRDIVLGTDWMRPYSAILFDFQQLKLSFKKGGRRLTLQGTEETTALKAISGKSLAKMYTEGA